MFQVHEREFLGKELLGTIIGLKHGFVAARWGGYPVVSSQELEALAQSNEAEGQCSRTVSMLEQTLWALHGLGSGLNLSYITHSSKFLRIASLAACSKALLLRLVTTTVTEKHRAREP